MTHKFKRRLQSTKFNPNPFSNFGDEGCGQTDGLNDHPIMFSIQAPPYIDTVNIKHRLLSLYF